MITNEARRSVSQNLRGGFDIVSDAGGRFWLNGTLFGLDISARSEQRIRDGLHHLADLIEPGCDRDALLELAEDMERAAPDYSLWEVCEGTDRNITDEVADFARRIREALGVDDA